MSQSSLPIQVQAYLSEEETNRLQSKWLKLCTKLGLGEKLSIDIYDRLYYEYNDWSRAYHNLSHIKSLLALSDQYADQIERKALFDMAIWFHDAIYDTKKKDNELRSAQLARELLLPHLSVDQVKFIQQLILSTDGHQPRLKHIDNTLFLDFDLAILATDWEIYQQYADAIEQEYKKWYNFFLYSRGRRSVMQRFLERPSLYFSAHFRANHEAQARRNVQKEIRQLSGKSE